MHRNKLTVQHGFSLIEMMVVLLLLSVLMGAVFRQISQVQARARTEQNRLDTFQESREFVDQISRDLRMAGYPNVRAFNSSMTTSDPNNAVGLVKVAVDELRFEGDIDGDGQVDSVRYVLDSTGTGCPCLKRSDVQPKINADPLTGQGTSYDTEVQNVQNGATTDPIFRAYDASGAAVTLPVDISSNPTNLAKIKTILISLKVQSPTIDLETRQRPQTTITAAVKINNCSGATTGGSSTCQ